MSENNKESLILNDVTDITETSWRLNVAQTPPADGAPFEDRYYLTSSYIDVEPESDPDRILSDPSYDHIDFTGMPSGMQYYVQAWRRYPGEPGRKRMMGRHGNPATCMTKEDVVTVDPSYRTIRFDMTNLKEFTHSSYNRAMHVRCMHDDVMGDFIRLDITGDGNSAVITSRRRFNKDKPIIVRGRVRNTGGPWAAFLLYNSEAEDMGVTWGVVKCDIRYTVNLPWSPGNVGSMRDRVADFEFVYDGFGKIHYWVQFPGEEKRLLGTRDYTLTTDPPIYFGSCKDKGLCGWTDFSNVEVIGEETFGFSEISYFYKYENSGIAGGTEWQHGYPQDGNEHYHAQGGYWSIRRYPKDGAAPTEFGGFTGGVSRDQHSYTAGEARMTTSKVQAVPGYRYDTVRLIGSRRSGGELKVYVKDAEGNVINGLPQTGGLKGSDETTGDEYFCPVYGVIQEVGLGGIDTHPIYFEAYVMNPNDGVTDQNMWSPPGLTPGEGTDTGPPCLKSLMVDFKPGQM